MNILVVSESPDLRSELQSRFDRGGLTASYGTHDDAILAGGQVALPALVVLDSAAGNPWALCRRIRDRAGNMALIWVIVRESGSEALGAALAAGADDCFALPSDVPRLDLRLAAATRQISALAEVGRVKMEMRESIERWSLAQRGARGGVWDARPGKLPLDSPEAPVWYSSEMKQLLGYSEEEFPDRLGSWLSRVHPDEARSVMHAILHCLEDKSEFEIEYRLRTKKGDYIWVNSRGQAILDAEGQIVRVTGSMRDITENRRIAEKLQESEAHWRSLVENAPDIITVVAPDGTIQFMNRDWRGITEARSLGRDLISLAPHDQRKTMRSTIEEVIRSGQSGRFELTLPGADGKLCWYASRVGPVHRADGVTALIIITTDITFRKRAEEEREQFVATIENSSDFIGMADASGKFLHVNPAGCELIGLRDQPSVREMSLADIYAADCRARYSDEILPLVQAEGRWSGEIRFRNLLTGHAIDVHQKIFLVPYPQSGAPLCLATISRDIGSRKRHEAALRQEQSLLRKLLDLHERDRQLVAYEIHDGMAQEMAAAVMHFQAFQHTATEMPEWKEFERGLNLLREAVQEARRLISGLRPPVLDEFGVITAIEYLVNEFRSEVPDIRFVHHTKFGRLAAPLESAIFRVVQEALSNIRRHSGSRRAKIELFEHGQQVRLVVRDWGKGFDPAKVREGSFGLQGIQQRGRLLGGKASIESRPGQGTTVVVDFPLILDRSETDAAGRAEEGS